MSENISSILNLRILDASFNLRPMSSNSKNSTNSESPAGQSHNGFDHITGVIRGVQTAPVIILSAPEKYIPSRHTWRLEQRSNALSQPLRTIISKQIHPGGAVSFLLGLIASFSGTSYNDIIEVPLERIDQYVGLGELEIFEHAQFEEELARQDEEEKEFQQRATTQLHGKYMKRGRGRPKKIREGALATIVQQGKASDDLPDTESEESSSSQSQVTDFIGNDDFYKEKFRVEVPSSPAYEDRRIKIPRSIFDGPKVKVKPRPRKSSIREAAKRPRGRPKGKSVAQALRPIPRSIHDGSKIKILSINKENQNSKIYEHSEFGPDKNSKLRTQDDFINPSELDERASLLLHNFQESVPPKSSQNHNSSRRLTRQGTPSSFLPTANFPKADKTKPDFQPGVLSKSAVHPSHNISKDDDSQYMDRDVRKDISSSDTEDEILFIEDDSGIENSLEPLKKYGSKIHQSTHNDESTGDGEDTLSEKGTSEDLGAEGDQAKQEVIEPKSDEVIEENKETKNKNRVEVEDSDELGSDVDIEDEDLGVKDDQAKEEILEPEGDEVIEESNETAKKTRTEFEDIDESGSDTDIEDGPSIERYAEASDTESETAEDLLARFKGTMRTQPPQHPNHITLPQHSRHRSHPYGPHPTHNPPQAPTPTPTRAPAASAAATPPPLLPPPTDPSRTTRDRPSMTSPYPPGTARSLSTKPTKLSTKTATQHRETAPLRLPILRQPGFAPQRRETTPLRLPVPASSTQADLTEHAGTANKRKRSLPPPPPEGVGSASVNKSARSNKKMDEEDWDGDYEPRRRGR